jgi:exodeoxyribonuclease VII small subunit
MMAAARLSWSVWIMKETYETKIEQLRQIIEKIEDGNTGLDESMKLYEQGAVLVKQCEVMLTEAELKITTLSRDA